ncbi:MAG TPA: hypothetical protein VH482_34830 [Thermomicrobiales bacterium]|jgi:hypothetical protein
MPVQVLDPNLRAGWEPDTAVEDSLLRRYLINWTESIEGHGPPGYERIGYQALFRFAVWLHARRKEHTHG